jgi:Fe-S-cluster containining protein
MTAGAQRIRVGVDPALSRLAYRCHPDGCPRDRTCCVGLAVSVSRREMRVIDSLMDEVSRFVPVLRAAGGYANVFTQDSGEIELEPRDEHGTCPFLFRTRGRALCAIHHVAVQSGRAVATVKPRACRHWPLVVETRGRHLRIGVHPSAQVIGCVAALAALPGQPSIRQAFAGEIEELRRLLGDPSGVEKQST